MQILEGINLAVRFTVELAALFALGWWGFHYGKTPCQKYGLAMIAPLTAAGVWGFFIAPNASVDVGTPFRLALQVVVFGAATLSLVATGYRRLALLFAIVVVLNGVLMIVWDQ
jgi:hypothetical protein